MTDEHDIKEKFFKALKSDRTIMLGLSGSQVAQPRPMTALLEDGAEEGPIWLFTSNETELGRIQIPNAPACATFASKGHNVFATFHGNLTVNNDRDMIERLWNPFVGAWFEGKDDPKITLLRFDLSDAEIWIDASSLLAGIKILLGADPKRDYEDKVAKVQL
ncbi:MAG: pyridoxamine 5'-phosphate oxidase family protein [Asticcacaulis sp.]